jgi:phage terminase large subunit
LPDNIEFIQSLFNDNPYTAEEYEKQLVQIKDKAMKQRLMYGNWEYEDDGNALIEYDAITDIFTNVVEKSDQRFITADIARFGKDKTVIMLWKGYLCDKIFTLNQQSLDVIAEEIKKLARDYMVPFSHIIADEDGVGGGVVDILKGIKGFVNNSVALIKGSVGSKENYRNLKTQCAYVLAEVINKHQLAIECNDLVIREQIIQELEQIKRKDPDKEGRLEIISKEDVKELIGRSPDYSDALLMRMWFKIKNMGESLVSNEDKLFYQAIKDFKQKKVGITYEDPNKMVATSIY